MGIRIAKAMGFNVIGVDINDDVLAEAKENGADTVVNSTSTNYESQVKKASNGGCHAAVVFSAAYPAFGSAIKILRIAGILMIIGLPAKALEFHAFDLMRKVYQIRSESTGPPQKMPRALEFISKNNIKPRVEVHKLDDIHEMMEKMRTGKSKSRMVVVF